MAILVLTENINTQKEDQFSLSILDALTTI